MRVELVTIVEPEDALLTSVLDSAGLTGSRGMARRLIAQGAVSIDGTVTTDASYSIPADQIWLDLRIAGNIHAFVFIVRDEFIAPKAEKI
jgi:16S rRNA U516 pseudouridylate synthase RsuA-like enzyme